MRTIKNLIFVMVLLVSSPANSQDTIRGFIKSSCMDLMPVIDNPKCDLKRVGDLIRISGMIVANCSGTHLAIVERSGDSIFITSKDTGYLATCHCLYSFEMFVRAPKTAKVLLFNSVAYDICSLVEYVNVPDTISGYFTSSCKITGLPYPEPQFRRVGDMLYMTGIIGANCAGTHLAIIKRSGDSILVTTKDTGNLATCHCDYLFMLPLTSSITDSILVFNSVVYHLNSISDGLDEVNEGNDLIGAFFDPTLGCLRIENKSVVKIKSVSIYDNLGCLQLTVANDRSIVDMSGFKSGMYILDFQFVDNRHLTRKIIIK